MREILTRLTELKTKLASQGADIYSFDLGNPQGSVMPAAIARLQREAAESAKYRYQPANGLPELMQAACARITKRHNLPLDPEINVVVSRGSKAALAYLPLMMLSPGDTAIVPNPCYAIHQDAVKLAHATPVLYECGPGIDIVDEIKRAFKRAPRAKYLLLNFPHNPTAVMITAEEIRIIAEIAHKHGTKIISDLTYDGLVFSGEPAPSVLKIAGMENVVETSTMSKIYNMAGHVGFVVGDPKILRDFSSFQHNFGYGVFAPLQLAAATALHGNEDFVTAVCEDYRKRDVLLSDGLNKIKWSVPLSLATMYKWVMIPQEYDNSEKFCEDLLEQAHVAVWPASGFGEGWGRYVRFASVEPQHRIPGAVEAIGQFING